MSFKKVFRHTIIYGISSSLNRATGFLLIPVYTRFMQPEEYGLLSLCQVLIGLLAILYEIGMNSSLLRYYFDCDTSDEKKGLIGTSVTFLLLYNLTITLLIMIFSMELSRIFLSGDSNKDIIILIGITVFFKNLNQVPFILFRVNNLSFHYSILSFIKLILTLGLNILFVVHLKRSVLGIMESQLIISFVFILLLLPYLIKNMRFTFNFTIFTKLCKFGLPLIPTNLIGFALLMSDRYILKMFVSMHEIGIYSLGYKLAMIVNIVAVNAISLAWPVSLMKLSKAKQTGPQIAKICTYLIGFICILVIFISLFIEEILNVIADNSYLGAGKVVPIVAFAYLFFAFYKLFESGIFIAKKPGYYPLITGAAGIVNISLNFLLIPACGFMAAAYNTLVAYVLLACLTLYVSNKLYPIPFEYTRLIFIVVLSAVLVIISRSINMNSSSYEFLLKVILLAAFPAILMLAGFFTLDEKEKIKKMFGYRALKESI